MASCRRQHRPAHSYNLDIRMTTLLVLFRVLVSQNPIIHTQQAATSPRPLVCLISLITRHKTTAPSVSYPSAKCKQAHGPPSSPPATPCSLAPRATPTSGAIPVRAHAEAMAIPAHLVAMPPRDAQTKEGTQYWVSVGVTGVEPRLYHFRVLISTKLTGQTQRGLGWYPSMTPEKRDSAWRDFGSCAE